VTMNTVYQTIGNRCYDKGKLLALEHEDLADYCIQLGDALEWAWDNAARPYALDAKFKVVSQDEKDLSDAIAELNREFPGVSCASNGKAG